MSTTKLHAGRYSDLNVLGLPKDEQRECHWWGCGKRARFSIKPWTQSGICGSVETLLCAKHAEDQVARTYPGRARAS